MKVVLEMRILHGLTNCHQIDKLAVYLHTISVFRNEIALEDYSKSVSLFGMCVCS